MKGPLARHERIGMTGIEHEQRATVLQHKASSFHRDSGTKGVIQTL